MHYHKSNLIIIFVFSGKSYTIMSKTGAIKTTIFCKYLSFFSNILEKKCFFFKYLRKGMYTFHNHIDWSGLGPIQYKCIKFHWIIISVNHIYLSTAGLFVCWRLQQLYTLDW